MASGTVQTTMNFKPSQVFVVERKQVGRNIQINSESPSSSITINISKSGYYPMSIVGWNVDNDPPDTANRGSSHYFFRLQYNKTEAILALKNQHPSMSGNVAAYIDVLYMKVI